MQVNRSTHAWRRNVPREGDATIDVGRNGAGTARLVLMLVGSALAVQGCGRSYFETVEVDAARTDGGDDGSTSDGAMEGGAMDSQVGLDAHVSADARVQDAHTLDANDAAWIDAMTADAMRDAGADANFDAGADAASPCCWWDRAYGARRQLRFDNRAQATALDSVPVLVRLDATRIDYTRTQSDGDDLRFVDADDATELPYEIERWTNGGTSVVWVQVPRIEAATDTDFLWMYYGSASAGAGARPTQVWDARHRAVWHLEDLRDSTAAGQGGVRNGGSDTMGNMASGQAMNGMDDWIDVGSPPGVDRVFFAGGGTVSAWVFAATWGQNGFGRIADKSADLSAAQGWGLQVDDRVGNNSPARSIHFEHGFSGGFGHWETSTDSMSLNAWHHVTLTYDNSSAANDPRVYIDGVEQAVVRHIGPTGTASDDAAQVLTIGNVSTTRNRTWDGVLDEVRIESGLRDTDWIRAQHLSGSDQFVIFGPEESPP